VNQKEKNPKKPTPVFAAVVIAMLLCAGALALFGKNSANRNAGDAFLNSLLTDTSRTNENVNTQVKSQNRNAQAPETTNASENINANRSTTTNASTNEPVLLVPAALERAVAYHGTQICLRGYYQSSFEFSAMAASYETRNGTRVLLDPLVWIATTIPDDGVECATTSAGQRVCFGDVTTCGVFRVANEGESGFGHVGAYRYELSQAPSAESVNNTLETTGGE
jgi:hypothetical protein